MDKKGLDFKDVNEYEAYAHNYAAKKIFDRFGVRIDAPSSQQNAYAAWKEYQKNKRGKVLKK